MIILQLHLLGPSSIPQLHQQTQGWRQGGKRPTHALPIARCGRPRHPPRLLPRLVASGAVSHTLLRRCEREARIATAGSARGLTMVADGEDCHWTALCTCAVLCCAAAKALHADRPAVRHCNTDWDSDTAATAGSAGMLLLHRLVHLSSSSKSPTAGLPLTHCYQCYVTHDTTHSLTHATTTN